MCACTLQSEEAALQLQHRLGNQLEQLREEKRCLVVEHDKSETELQVSSSECVCCSRPYLLHVTEQKRHADKIEELKKKVCDTTEACVVKI